MKKLFSIIAFALIAFAVHAEEDVVLLPTKAQAGTTAKVGVVVKHDPAKGPAAGIIFFYSIPDGTTISGITALGGGSGDYNPLNCKASYDGYEALTTAHPDDAVICTLDVEIPEDMELGEYPVALYDIQVVYEDGITDFLVDRTETTITVQKTAVIEPLDANNDIEVTPFVFVGGGDFDDPINASVLMKSESYVKSLEFDFELPTGISVPSIEEDGDVIYAEPELENNKGTVSVEITKNDDGSYHYSLSGTSTKYIYAADEMTTFSTLPLMSTGAIEEGVYTLKIYNISMTTKNDEFEGGNYYASVIVGQPAAQEVILYGNYDQTTASAFSTALKNVAIADVTAATVADGVKFTDVLVNEKGGNSYYTRTSAYYGTTVLPLDLTPENVDELYKIESMDSESIVITEALEVAANTPCIFKGTINVEGATPTLGVPSEQGLGQTTFKGTYQATEIAAGDGYYISSDGCFYNDGATVRPFRGYFEGTVSGAKLRILLHDETGVKDITNELSEEAIYTLQGIRVNNAQKGINIKGGKKVYVK